VDGTELNEQELRRYARHLLLPEVGVEGQQRIRAARVLCVGAGGLGSPVVLYLAAAGIGRLGVVDDDVVDVTNLQRQIIHRTKDVGRSKIKSATKAIHRLNPAVEVAPHKVRLASDNALEILQPYDLVVDATDNFPTRYLANDACVLLRKPYLYGAIFRFEGQASVLAPHLGGPCYRCLYPEPPAPGTAPSCADAGVLGVLPGIIGCIQATEALKLVLGIGTPLIGRLLLLDALAMQFRELKIRRDPQCPLCGEQPTITRLIDYAQFCGETAPAAAGAAGPDEVTVHDLKRALADASLGIRVIDVREPAEQRIAHIAGVELFPLSQLAESCARLDPDQPLYIHCKSGSRSLQAVKLLKARGFKSVRSVRGGIAAWSRDVDPTVPQY
jgi:sulfur-carrier protein adenylyltransferase/sulfurtransferase